MCFRSGAWIWILLSHKKSDEGGQTRSPIQCFPTRIVEQKRTFEEPKQSSQPLSQFSSPVTNNSIVSDWSPWFPGRNTVPPSNLARFWSCPSVSRGNYCNCHFFCSFSSKEENGKSFLFLGSSFFLTAVPCARCKLCPLQLWPHFWR